MNCKTINNRLLDFIDNNLPENEMQAIRAHLDECDKCRSLYVKMQDAWQNVNEDKIPYQPFFYTRLKAKMEDRYNKSTRFQQLQKLILQPALYFVILGFGIFIGIQIGQGVDNTETETTAYMNEMEYWEISDNNQQELIQVDSLEQAILEIENQNKNE
ncbi:MAG: zf-HC2 domain-containing protein [Bacteroidales bacterium]